jgi:hypothetical protein
LPLKEAISILPAQIDLIIESPFLFIQEKIIGPGLLRAVLKQAHLEIRDIKKG